MIVAKHIDALGLLCPLPVLKARKALLEMSAGDVLSIDASDPAAVIDMPHFCGQAGHAFLACEDIETGQRYFIRRGA